MKILCIGRNYVAHARELNSPLPEEPVFFSKPDTALLRDNKPFYLPDFSSNMHHEIELVLRICKLGKNIDEQYAYRYYDAIGLGVDFTARDLQMKQKEKGLPWEIAKAFDQSAPISRFLMKEEFEDVADIPFSLRLNGVVVQEASSKLMIFPFDQVVSYLSRFITLKTGDLIFTGTPAGVGPVQRDDHLEGFINDQKLLDFKVL